jgi:general secretion pathway protein J
MRRERGFTLVEMLISLAIIGFMMLVAWGTIMQTTRAKKHYEAIQDRYREVRLALGRIEKDLSMAYLSSNQSTLSTEPMTMFVGESSISGDAIHFSSLAHNKVYANANESDQTVISYYIDSDPDDRSVKNIYRRETRMIAQEKWDTLPADTDVLFTGVEKFKLEYFDPKDREWEEAWSTVSADGKPNRLPDRVRITLGFKDERGKDVTFTTQTKIPMQEQLVMIAN